MSPPAALEGILNVTLTLENLASKIARTDISPRDKRRLATAKRDVISVRRYFETQLAATRLEPVRSPETISTTGDKRPVKSIVEIKKDAAALAQPFENIRTLTSALRTITSIFGDTSQNAQFVEIEHALKNVARLLRAHPQRVLSAYFKHLADVHLSPDPNFIEQARLVFVTQSAEDQQQTVFLGRMVTSGDIVGVILRGHILIERELRKCIEHYFVCADHDLWLRRRVSFRTATEIAYALGIILQDERALLASINDLRILAAHDNAPITKDQVQSLWQHFLALKVVPRKFWPTFNEQPPIDCLTHIVLFISALLDQRRKHRLEHDGVSAAAEMLKSEDPILKQGRSAAVMFSVKALRLLAESGVE